MLAELFACGEATGMRASTDHDTSAELVLHTSTDHDTLICEMSVMKDMRVRAVTYNPKRLTMMPATPCEEYFYPIAVFCSTLQKSAGRPNGTKCSEAPKEARADCK